MLPARVQQSGCGQENAPQQVSIKFNPPHHTNTTAAAAAATATPRHPKTNKHTEQRGIHHRCFWFDKSLCFSITIISPELDKGSGRGWKMERNGFGPPPRENSPPPPFFFPPALRLEMIALHRSCKGVGDYILILQLTLLEAPFEWNPRVLSKKPYYGNDLTRGGGGRKKVFKTSFRFFFFFTSSRERSQNHEK